VTPKPKLTAKVTRAREYRRAFERICDRIEAGEGVVKITTGKKAGLSQSGFYKMLGAGDAELVERYTHARAIQADRLADEILEIADDSTNDYMVRNGKIEINSENVNRSRLRIDARKWLAGKLKPKVYGDKQIVDVNHGVQEMDDDALEAHTRQIAERLGVTLPDHLIRRPEAPSDKA